MNSKPMAINTRQWFVYILKCSDGSLYTGVTTDVKRRSKQHNAGTASRYTRSRLPVRVVYQEPHASRSLALKREWTVKALQRLEMNPWYDVACDGGRVKRACFAMTR